MQRAFIPNSVGTEDLLEQIKISFTERTIKKINYFLITP